MEADKSGKEQGGREESVGASEREAKGSRREREGSEREWKRVDESRRGSEEIK